MVGDPRPGSSLRTELEGAAAPLLSLVAGRASKRHVSWMGGGCTCVTCVKMEPNRFLLGRVVDLPVRLPNPSPTLDKNLASMGPGIFISIGVGVWRKAPEAFPDSNTTLDTFQSATSCPFRVLSPVL